MQKRSRRSSSVSFWRNLFLNAAQQQQELLKVEIQRIHDMSAELCKALEPMVTSMQINNQAHPSFYGCVQVLRALDERRRRLESYQQNHTREGLFDIEEYLNSPLLIQTNPVEETANSQYGIESNNLESFVGLFVQALEVETREIANGTV